MLKKSDIPERLTVPNLVTILRMAAVPVLIIFSAMGYEKAFLTLFALSVASDALDGYLARRLKQTSVLGTRLDSWADLMMWSGALLCAWLLWPEMILRELPYALFALSAFVLPMAVGYLKYGVAPSYHCWSAKIQAILITVVVFILLFTHISWPFRVVAVLQIVPAAEDIAITLLLPKCHHNISSVWHALKFKNL